MLVIYRGPYTPDDQAPIPCRVNVCISKHRGLYRVDMLSVSGKSITNNCENICAAITYKYQIDPDQVIFIDYSDVLNYADSEYFHKTPFIIYFESGHPRWCGLKDKSIEQLLTHPNAGLRKFILDKIDEKIEMGFYDLDVPYQPLVEPRLP